MNDFATRLMKSKELSEINVKKNVAEAQAMVTEIMETLVSRIEKSAEEGSVHLSASCNVTEMQLLSYTQLIGLSEVKEGINAFKGALRDLVEGTGELQFSTPLGMFCITLTL